MPRRMLQGPWSRHGVEVCPICGVPRSGAPRSVVLYREYLDKAALTIAEEIMLASANSRTSRDPAVDVDPSLVHIVKEALSTTLPNPRQNIRPEWMPDGVGREDTVTLTSPKHYSTWRWIAVGYFKDDRYVDEDPEQDDGLKSGYCLARDKGGIYNFPDGRNAQIRTVTDDRPFARFMRFDQVVFRAGEAQVQTEDLFSTCNAWDYPNANIAMCERCYYYLKYWLDTAGLPAPLISFPGELYEIVNSQLELRKTRGSSQLP